MRLCQSCPSGQEAPRPGSPLPRSPARQQPRASPWQRRAHGSRQHRDPRRNADGLPRPPRVRRQRNPCGLRAWDGPRGAHIPTQRDSLGESPAGQWPEPAQVPNGPHGSPSPRGAPQGTLTHPSRGDCSAAGPWGLAWQGFEVGEDGRASQASCASGDGQLEGVENQPFPPPEGAPEDSSATGRRRLASAPRRLRGSRGKRRETKSSLFWGVGEEPGREKQPARTLEAQKQAENDQFGFL